MERGKLWRGAFAGNLRNPALGTEQALEQVLAFLYMHECYHLGQIGIIRKLHGLPGAI